MHQIEESTKSTKDTNDKILFKDENYSIQGAVFEVYREMGCVMTIFVLFVNFVDKGC
mgnify:CR=1 FL=1